MMKTFRTSWIFIPLAFVCGLLCLRFPNESLFLGVIYASAITLRLPRELGVRDLFPLVMLFLFLMVLTESPPRLFTVSLIYTTRALIVFRALIISLNRIQANDQNASRTDWLWITGVALEFVLSAIFVYSTFKPVSLELLAIDHFLLGGALMLFSSVGMPYWIPGVIFGALSFYPSTRIWGIMGFGLLAVYESNFSKRSRNLIT